MPSASCTDSSMGSQHQPTRQTVSRDEAGVSKIASDKMWHVSQTNWITWSLWLPQCEPQRFVPAKHHFSHWHYLNMLIGSCHNVNRRQHVCGQQIVIMTDHGNLACTRVSSYAMIAFAAWCAMELSFNKATVCCSIGVNASCFQAGSPSRHNGPGAWCV